VVVSACGQSPRGSPCGASRSSQTSICGALPTSSEPACFVLSGDSPLPLFACRPWVVRPTSASWATSLGTQSGWTSLGRATTGPTCTAAGSGCVQLRDLRMLVVLGAASSVAWASDPARCSSLRR
jgi:hypothetical protein